MVLLGIQVVLGGLTVLKLLEAKTVSAHLLNALLFYAVLLWMTFRVRRLATDPTTLKTFNIPPVVKGLFIAVTLGLFAQIALGGMVSSNFAGIVCPDFPKCHGEWVPPLLFPFVIQMLHRAVGFVVLALVLALWIVSYRATLPKIARLTVTLVPLLVAAQIILGVVNVVYALPIAASAAHLANAVAIYTLMILGTLSVFADNASYDKFAGQDAGSTSYLAEGRLA
jgi:heme A synthase